MVAPLEQGHDPSQSEFRAEKVHNRYLISQNIPEIASIFHVLLTSIKQLQVHRQSFLWIVYIFFPKEAETSRMHLRMVHEVINS